MRHISLILLPAFLSPAAGLSQSEFHHEQERQFYLGEYTEELFRECEHYINSIVGYAMEELKILLGVDASRTVIVKEDSIRKEEGAPFRAEMIWYEPVDKVNEEYMVTTSCVELTSDGIHVVILDVKYRYFATEFGAFEPVNQAGYYLYSIVSGVTWPAL